MPATCYKVLGSCSALGLSADSAIHYLVWYVWLYLCHRWAVCYINLYCTYTCNSIVLCTTAVPLATRVLQILHNIMLTQWPLLKFHCSSVHCYPLSLVFCKSGAPGILNISDAIVVSETDFSLAFPCTYVFIEWIWCGSQLFLVFSSLDGAYPRLA